MEYTYTIRTGNGEEYGPATLDQLTGWAREGRLNEQTEIRRSDMEHWAAAASFVELQGVFAPPPMAAIPPTLSPNPSPTADNPQLLAHMKSGASWFYWIAGLSLVNSLSAFGGWGIQFLFGLGITRELANLGAQVGDNARVVTLGLNVVVAGIFICFGVFAHKRHLWAFIVGMALFAMDAVLMLRAGLWISVAFHAFVLYCLYRGLQACRGLNAAR